MIVLANYFLIFHHIFFLLSALSSPEWWKCCEYWIGGNDMYEEGTFSWISDNSTLDFVNWYPSEPDNNNNQDCVSICGDEHWADRFCISVWPYICKVPAIQTISLWTPMITVIYPIKVWIYECLWSQHCSSKLTLINSYDIMYSVDILTKTTKMRF